MIGNGVKPEELEVIHNTIEPGYTLEAVIKVLGGFENKNRPLTLALTPKSVHFIGFKKKFGSLEMMGHASIPIDRISTVATSKKGSGVVISFWWEGNQETVFCRWPNEAEELTSKLKGLIATRSNTGAATSVADEIAKLSQLADEGILTQDELQRAKEMFLGKPSSQIDESVRLLRNLRDLNKQGILSESEFNMKKWDVLSKRDFQ